LPSPISIYPYPVSGLVGFDILLSTLSDFRLNEENKPIVDVLLLNESIAQRKNNESSISGYSLISDIHSDAIFILQTTQDRAFYQQKCLSFCSVCLPR